MIQIPSASRVLLRVPLRPAQGDRFQPTGYPDIGAGTYQLPDGTEMLLVESEQSVANRLEAVCFEPDGSLRSVLEGLPYVVVEHEGRPLTNSMLEAHRLNSVYVENSSFRSTLEEEVGHEKTRPVDLRRLAKVLLRYDAASLLHGIFLESIAGTLRFPRALGGFVEARDVQVVATGGVKNDHVTPSTEKGSKRTAKEGYGNVPFHRDAYVAARIDAFFNLDLAQIRSYGLPESATALLFTLALWKIRVFLDEGLRLRSACDFVVDGEPIVDRPEGFDLPSRSDLEAALPERIRAAASDGLLAEPAVTVAEYQGK
jgi:CRISPR-associated protein Csb1